MKEAEESVSEDGRKFLEPEKGKEIAFLRASGRNAGLGIP